MRERLVDRCLNKPGQCQTEPWHTILRNYLRETVSSVRLLTKGCGPTAHRLSNKDRQKQDRQAQLPSLKEILHLVLLYLFCAQVSSNSDGGERIAR